MLPQGVQIQYIIACSAVERNSFFGLTNSVKLNEQNF